MRLAILFTVIVAACYYNAGLQTNIPTGSVTTMNVATGQPVYQGNGTMSCAEIGQNCDMQCPHDLSGISCVHACSSQGTPQAAAQHEAVIQCQQNNHCFDEDCMRANCTNEINTCAGAPVVQQQGGGY
jgi:hypothetical protein